MTRRCLRDTWLQEVLCSKLIRDACRVLLLYLATGAHQDGPHAGQPLMAANGYVRGVKHAEMARRLQISEKQIGRRLQEAREAGLLAIVGGGYNGQPTMYAAQISGLKAPLLRGSSVGPASLRDFVKAPAPRGPSRVAERGPSAGNGSSREVTKTPAEGGPYVRARTRATRESREQEPAPADSRGPRPRRSANSSSNGKRARRLSLVAACPSAPTHRTGDNPACA